MSGVQNAKNWTLIGIQTGFNALDTVGRWMAGCETFDLSIPVVKRSAAVRILFVFTFLAVALEWPPQSLFQTDWFQLTNIVLLALSNGYIMTLCGIKAPSTVEDESQRASVGGYIGFCIQIGVFSGTIVAACFAPLLKAQEAIQTI